jgi:hypothetical protein
VKLLLLGLMSMAAVDSAVAQVVAPNYEEFRLDAIFPAGGRRGETVSVEFLGSGACNLSGAKSVLIDGPAGITVQDVKNISNNRVQANFIIAADAPPGRREVRVLSEHSGLTNMIYFTVGLLPEVLETEPNNDSDVSQPLVLPVVVNGRVDPAADIDCFRLELRQGQRISAAVLAHHLDSHGQGRNYGFVDARLELLDEGGRVVAEAGDTLGLDPALEYTAPAAGIYTARISLEAFAGHPQAVYRFMVGKFGIATGLFPPGGRRGTLVEAEVTGLNLPAGARQQINLSPGDDRLFQRVVCDLPQAADTDLPFILGDLPETLEHEPNEAPTQATPLAMASTVNGRIDRPGDVDWFQIRLAAKEGIVIETTAHRFLRSPVDTLLEVYDGAGKKLAENDDGFAIDYISMHDYRSTDSRLSFDAPSTGDYFIRVSDQAGAAGPRAVYRLTAAPRQPHFDVYLYPDGVPIWGPGTTAAFLVKVDRFDKMDGDIKLTIEDLPAGWIGSETVCRGPASVPPQTSLPYYLLTLTAPPNATPATVVPLRVVGQAVVNGQTMRQAARSLTWYYTSDIGLFRLSGEARAVVTTPRAPALRCMTSMLVLKRGTTLEVPVEVTGMTPIDQLDMTADLAIAAVATGLGPPQNVKLSGGRGILPVKVPNHVGPGKYGITISLRWRSDIRIGMPGPCTPLLSLDVIDPAPSGR